MLIFKKNPGPRGDSRPEVHILIPVWGTRYIDDFITFSLPALLAPGNLPVLAKECRVTVVFLTSRGNFEHFQKRSEISQTLAGHCGISFIPIDDLIHGTKHYSVPLTLAFLRGITMTGEAMTRTYFLSFCSDFVLADGSLKSVLRHIQDNRSIILAPSFRVIREAVKPILAKHLIRTQGQLSMQSREMARLAFCHIHPTVTSRIVNQPFFHSLHPNQIYWRVDQNTFLARFYLIMQLCIKPERRVETVNDFFDYAFLPEMCPSGDMAVITDSDEFFMMELQATNAEDHFTQSGPPNIQYIAKDVSNWTTAEHRKISHAELVFHSEVLPESLPSARKELGRFMGKVEERIAPRSVPHDRHHFWPGAIQTWLYDTDDIFGCGSMSASGKERNDDLKKSKRYFSGVRSLLSPQTLEYYFKIKWWKSLAMAVFWGVPPKVRLWHPQWFSYFLLKSRLRSCVDRKEPILYVTDETDFDGFFEEATWGDKVLPRDLLRGFLYKSVRAKRDYPLCFIYLTERTAYLSDQLVDYISGNLPRTERILLYVGQNLSHCGPEPVTCTTIAMMVSHFNSSYPGQAHYRFMGGVLSGLVHKQFRKIFTLIDSAGLLGRFVLAGRILLASIAMLFANAWAWLWHTTERVPLNCTGMMIEFEFRNSMNATKLPSHAPCAQHPPMG